MRKMGILLILLLLLTVGTLVVSAKEVPRDGYAEVIKVSSMSNEEAAIVSVANGENDMFLFSRPGGAYKDLSKDILDKLRLVKSSSVYQELTLNPVHTEGDLPLVKVGDKIYMNPFAIREVRFAVNFLVNREYLVQNIYQGSAQAQYGAFHSLYPFNEKMQDLYAALGLSPEGDKNLAIQMIDEAMNEAAKKLAEAGYTLEKKDGKWYFEGEPVVITGISRVEDERKDIGTYFANLLEEAGFTVDNKIVDRKTAIKAVYLTDPTNYEWNFYTGGWVSEAVEAWPETEIPQFYSSWYWGLPAIVGWQHKPAVTVKDLLDYIGGADKITLNYYKGDKVNEILDFTVDDVTKLLVNGVLEKDSKKFELESEDQYWDLQKLGMGLGIMDSVRVFLVSNIEFFPVNKERVSEDMMVDPISGLYSRNALLTAKTPDKVLKVIQFSSTGALFMSAFNPIGSDDIYAMLMWRLVSEPALWPDETGIYQPVVYEYKVEKGDISVPSSAVVYNSSTDKWEPAKETKAAVKVTFKVKKFGKWHSGEQVDMNDIKYYIAFLKEWSTKDSDDDTYYDESLEYLTEVFNNIVGIKFNEDGYTVYGNYAHVVAEDLTASYYAMYPEHPWELWYVLGEMVAKGYDGKKWSFSEASEGVNQIDELLADHVEEIKKALEDMKGQVPAAIADSVSAEEAKKRYEADIAFIEKYGHAVISCGPYMVEKYNPESLYMQLIKFQTFYEKPVVTTTTEVVKKTTTVAATTTPVKKPTPGFELVGAMLGLVAALYLLRRRAG